MAQLVKQNAKLACTAPSVGLKSSPVAIFQGYDTVTGGGLSMALDGKTQLSGGYSQVSYRVCYGMKEVSEALGVSASLTATFWSKAGISAKLDFVNNLKLTTHSTCIVVSAKHTEGKETATDWALKPGVEAPTGREKLLNFFRVYGDSFLSGRTKGGEYYAVYTFYSESQERQSDLTAELQAEGLLSVVSLNASVQAKLSKVSSTQTSRASLDQIISGISNPKLPGADSIVQFALDFPSLTLTSPVVVDLEVTGYERVAGIGASFVPIAANRTLMVGLEPKLVQLKQLQNGIGNINDIYDFYGGYSADTKLAQVKSEADNDAKAVREMITAYETDPTKALSSPGLHSLAYGTPSLMYSIQRTQNFVAGQGQPFDDIDRSAYLQQKTRISALQLRLRTDNDFKRVISYFRVTYTNAAQGSRVIEHGRGNSGQLTEELLLSPGRVVISAVSGNIANDGNSEMWRSLGFELSDARKVFYGYYGEGFRWTVPQGSFLLGFSGRFSSFLTELQCVYASFRQASWRSTSTSFRRGYQALNLKH